MQCGSEKTEEAGDKHAQRGDVERPKCWQKPREEVQGRAGEDLSVHAQIAEWRPIGWLLTNDVLESDCARSTSSGCARDG